MQSETPKYCRRAEAGIQSETQMLNKVLSWEPPSTKLLGILIQESDIETKYTFLSYHGAIKAPHEREERERERGSKHRYTRAYTAHTDRGRQADAGARVRRRGRRDGKRRKEEASADRQRNTRTCLSTNFA